MAHWPLLAGLLLLVIPSLLSLAEESWSTEAGVHGPIVLATGAWLLWRRRAEIAALRQRGNTALALAVAIPALLIYAVARAFDFLAPEILSLLIFLLAVSYAHFGGAVLRMLWFPIFYLLFLVPLPGWLVDSLTAPLKTFVSWAASHFLDFAGYPIVREGVTLYVAQYQLLVEDACSGLNSLISLSSVSLFYIYLLHNATWRYSLLLAAWIIPLAIFANIIRIIILVLITYHMGNEAAQGFLHSTAGFIMFVIALVSILFVDSLMQWTGRKLGWIKA